MSDFYNKYPYTDFHELNLDWVIERVKKLTEDWAATLTEWNNTEEQWQQLYDYVHDYFDNLDVQQEINNKINAMIADGTFMTIAAPIINSKIESLNIPGLITNWLIDNITQPTTPVIDKSLTIEEAGADALSAGLTIKNNHNKIVGIQTGNAAKINFSKSLMLQDKAVLLDNNTFLSTLSSCVLSIKDSTAETIIIPVSSSPLNNYPAVLLRLNGNIVGWTTASDSVQTVFDCSAYTYDEIVINYWGAYTTPYYDHVEAVYPKLLSENDAPSFAQIRDGVDVLIGKWNVFNDGTINMDDIHDLRPGYCTLAGIVSSPTHFYTVIQAKDVKAITINPTSDTPAIEYAFHMDSLSDNNATALIGTSGGTYYAMPKFKKGFIVVNCFMGANYQHSFEVQTWPDNNDNIMHIVNKPLVFSSKTAVFTGDSITAGFTSGGTTTTETYPKLFSNKVGLTYTNIAIGGAFFVAGYNLVTTIVDQVKSIATDPDYIFIAGGINDWQGGVTLFELKTAIQYLCDWLNANKPGAEVIWILPINEAGWETTHTINPTDTLDAFRRAIFEVVESNNNGNFSVVNGKLFNFPVMGNNTSFVNTMFGDLLHPSETGYRTLYTRGLLNALC